MKGDPHPGNVLLLKDNSIGLIDYGQVKRLTREDLKELATLIILLCDKKEREVIDLVKKMGFTTEKNNDSVLYDTVVMGFDSDEIAFKAGNIYPFFCVILLAGLSMHQFMEEMNRKDKTKTIPEQYVMVVRVSMLLRGISTLLGVQEPISICNYWRPYAEKVLRDSK